MKILLTGSSTPLGSAVLEHFFKRGDTIYSFSNLGKCKDELRDEILATIKKNPIDAAFLLHGEELLHSPLRRSILKKRSETILSIHKDICNLLFSLSTPPKKVFMGSSSLLTTTKDTDSQDFLKIFFIKLEEQVSNLNHSKTRTLYLRTGKIISNLPQQNTTFLPIFRNTAFSPRIFQKLPASWISLEDALRAIIFLHEKNTLSGVINVTSGEQLNQGELNLLLCKKNNLHHFPVPLFFLNLLFGKPSTSLLQPIEPSSTNKLLAAGFNIKNVFLSEYLGLPH